MKAKRKRFLSSLLVAALLLQMAPFEALAADGTATVDPPVVDSESTRNTEPTKTDDEAVYDDDVSPPETYIDGELTEERDEYEKHYRLTDGSFLAAQFQVPVHYEADGSWEDIDNTLDGVALYDGTEVYQAVNGDHIQSFAVTLADGTVLSVADGEQSLTMALWDGEKDAAEDKPVVIDQEPEDSSTEEQPDAPETSEPTEESTVESKLEETPVSTSEEEPADADSAALDDETVETSQDDTSISGPEEAQPEETQRDESTAHAEPGTTEEETELEEALPAFNRETKAEILTGAASPVTVQSTPELREVTDVIPETLENSIIYRDVYPGVDLKYETFSYNVKESIILNAPAAQSETEDDAESTSRYVYTFQLTLDGLTPVQQEDGSILLQNGDGETEYTIPAPFMEDSDGIISADVGYTLEENTEGWRLSIQADPAWLDAEDRAYPVTIDPTLIRTFYPESIQSTTTYSTASPTNYLAYYQMMVGQSASFGELKMFFRITGLPKIPAGHTVIGAQIGLTMCDNYAPETVYLGISQLTSALTDAQYAKLATPWTSAITYKSPMDYLKFDTSSKGDSDNAPPYYWDITNAAVDWYEDPATNYGLAITSVAASYKNSDVWLRFHQDEIVFLVGYRNTAGTESYYTYEVQDGGRAGTGYVGDYSSELTVMKTDVAFPNSAMSYSLGHVFNSGLRQGNLVTSDLSGISVPDYSKMKMGYGWQLTAQESLKRVKINGITYLVYRDSDGTEHYCPKKLYCEYHDEDGLGLTFISGSEEQDYEYAMTDADGNKKYFWNGYLMYMADTVGNRICFLYNGVSYSSTSLVSWRPPSSGAYLTSIVSVNKGETTPNTICTFSYTNDYLTGITDWAGRTTTFTYTDGELTKITHPDNTDVYYTYTSEQKHLSAMYDDEAKYGVSYTYTGNRVASIQEFTAASYGGTPNYGAQILRSKNGLQETVYQYNGNDRVFDSEDDIITRYSFDHAGRTINAVTLDQSQTQILGVTAAAYTSASGTAKHKNRIEKDAQSGQNGINLLTAGGLEVHDTMTAPANSWKLLQASGTGRNAAVKNTSSDSSALTRTGNGSLKIYLAGTATENSAGIRRMGMYQEVSLTAGTAYTFSAYVNTRDVTTYVGDGGLYVAFMDTAGNILAAGDRVVAVTNSEIENGWQRVHVTYTPTTSGTYRVAAIQENAYLYGYFDDFQLEKGTAASNVNLLQNGSFSSSAEWAMGNFYIASGDTLHPGVIEVTSYPGTMKRASQTVPINGPATNTYLLSGWGWAPSAANTASKLTDATAENNTSERYFGLIACCNYSDGTKEYFYMPFNDDYNGWQYTSCVIAPKKDNQSKTIQSITVTAAYDCNINTVWFDNISLRQEPCTTYTYDSDGNVIAVNATGNSAASFKYAAGTTDLTEANTKSGGIYKYTYNSNHLVTKITNDNVSMNITYDKYGNSTATTLSSDSDSSAGKIVTTAEYSSDGSQLLSQTDANGNKTSYTYNAQRKVSAQTDAKGTVNQYSYNSKNDRPSVSYQLNVVSAAYVYSCGNLVTLRRSNFLPGTTTKLAQTYSMDYDSFGNMTGISVGNRRLASYEYGAQNTALKSMTYGNGVTVSYTYDTLGRVTEEFWEGNAKYQYAYSADGDLAKKVDVTTGIAVNYQYDSLGRLIYSYQTNDGTITRQTEHLYDTENRLQRFSYSIPGVISSTSESFTYNTDASDSIPTGSLTSMAMFNSNWIYYRYDSLARLKERDVGNLLTEHQTYLAGSETGTTTMRPETFYTTAKDGSTKLTGFQYTYDAVGNITKATNQVDSSYWKYAYDTLGQLQYATDYQPNGIATYRYKYYYDNAGNLTSWKIQDDSGTVTKVSHTYTYGDSDWLDLLTAFDGETITYDGAGNPLSYYNGSRYTMTWKHGRQLASATVGGKTYSYQYDADGIRTRKTNFDGGYTEYYVVEGLPVAEQRFTAAGAKLYILQYLYDESNNAVGFGIYYPTDTSPNWQYYYFGKNIQGDVIALYRSDYNSSNGTYSPTLVATYSYDPWGTPTGIYDANGAAISQTADHVAAYNPFRYRGYHYDGDTRLYYLQSRYYDPATGRFVNADGYTSTGQGLVGHNMFAYCGNNPVIRKDSSGELWMAVASSALLGGIGGVVTALAAGDNPVIGFAVGAVTSGASTLFGFGEIGSAIATGVMGAYTSVLGNIFEQSANQREINWGEVLLSAGTGFVNGAVESLIGKGMASAVLECSVANLVVDTVTSALTTANTVTANAYYGALRTNGTSNSNSKPRYINRWSSQTYVRTQQRYGRKLPKRYTTRQRVM